MNMESIKLDNLRDLVGTLNRGKNPSGAQTKLVTEMYSPPFKGDEKRKKEYLYPPQLSGLHGKKEQAVNVSGDTSGKTSFDGGGGSGFAGGQ